MSTDNTLTAYVLAATFDESGSFAGYYWVPYYGGMQSESIAPAEAHDDIYVDAETGEPLSLELQAEMKKFAEDMEAREWAHKEAEKEDEQRADVARRIQEEDAQKALVLESVKEEIKSLHIEAIKLAEKQQPLWGKISLSWNTGVKLADYWNVWEEMIRLQKLWLDKDEKLKTLVAKALAINPEFSFNDYAKTYDPHKKEGVDEDYEKRHRNIRVNFVRNIEKDEAYRAKGLAKRAETSAPGTEKPAYTVADFASAQLAKEAAGGGRKQRKPRVPPLSGLKSEPAVWGDM